MVEKLAWLVLFLPLMATVVIAFFTRSNKRLSAQISIGAVLLSFVLGLILCFAWEAIQEVDIRASWLSVGDLSIDFGIQLDRLSLLMLLIVTGVGSLIHIFSYGYMHKDPGISRYFAFMSLFTFSMVGIVLADNFIMMFIFWELVGLSSYLLIGFWYSKPSAADASKKAFLTNRLGDFGFILGILMIWASMGTLNFQELSQKDPAALGGLATIAGLLIFCGAMGKSAQFPLHVWLPDAMEGPTPVSALIHAATMVAAGVYMLCRVVFLFNAPVLEVIAWIGVITSLLAALMAVQQNDIKRILAYSTLSQLGYMVMAVGLLGSSAAMYHLTTHAFFKALLFLGAGSVIYAVHHEQDIWKMGGLFKKMPYTYWTFLIATLALCGCPPFSGFFSKDAILAAAFDNGKIHFMAMATLVAFLTAFYMFRLFLVVFHGDVKSTESKRAQESPKIMTVPLMVLAFCTLLSGFWGIDQSLNSHFGGESHEMSLFQTISHAVDENVGPVMFGLLAMMLGFSMAFSLYAKAESDPLPGLFGGFAKAMKNRFYFDEFYQWLIARTHDAMASAANFFDQWIIAGLFVRGTHGAAELVGRTLRLLQTGNLQTYAFLLVIGVALMLYLVIGG